MRKWKLLGEPQKKHPWLVTPSLKQLEATWLLCKIKALPKRDWRMVKMRLHSLTGGRTFILIEKVATLPPRKFEKIKLDFIERLKTCFSKFSLVYIEGVCFHGAFMPSYIYLTSYHRTILILNTYTCMCVWGGICVCLPKGDTNKQAKQN